MSSGNEMPRYAPDNDVLVAGGWVVLVGKTGEYGFIFWRGSQVLFNSYAPLSRPTLSSKLNLYIPSLAMTSLWSRFFRPPSAGTFRGLDALPEEIIVHHILGQLTVKEILKVRRVSERNISVRHIFIRTPRRSTRHYARSRRRRPSGRDSFLTYAPCNNLSRPFLRHGSTMLARYLLWTWSVS